MSSGFRRVVVALVASVTVAGAALPTDAVAGGGMGGGGVGHMAGVGGHTAGVGGHTTGAGGHMGVPGHSFAARSFAGHRLHGRGFRRHPFFVGVGGPWYWGWPAPYCDPYYDPYCYYGGYR